MQALSSLCGIAAGAACAIGGGLGFYWGKDDRDFDYAGVSYYAELLYYGKKYEKRRHIDSKHRGCDHVTGVVYVDGMDFCAENGGVDFVINLSFVILSVTITGKPLS